MNTKELIQKKLAAVVVSTTGKNILESNFLQTISVEGSSVILVLEIPVALRNERLALQESCGIALQEVEGVEKVDVQFRFQVQEQASKPATKPQQSPSKNIEALKDVKNIIAIASGKGGVGKSTVTANLAAALVKTGATVGVMDLDIYGPSMNMMFGVDESPQMDDKKKLFPVIKNGIRMVSMAMFTDADSAVIWRGPMVSQMVQNFLSNVNWGALDYLLLDLPPGTGDIQLTLTQTAPLTGAIIVTTPQEVSLLDAKKGLRMFEKVSVPVLGIIENMSQFIADDGKAYYIFQKGGGSRIAQSLGIPFCGEIPIHPEVSRCGDLGNPIVNELPENPVSLAYTEIASEIKKRLVILKDKEQHSLLTYDFTWDSIPKVNG